MKKKKVLSLGLVAANIASMSVNAATTDDMKMGKNNEVKIERNVDNEDNSIVQLDYKSTTLSANTTLSEDSMLSSTTPPAVSMPPSSTTPPAVTIPPIEDKDEHSELINTMTEERVIQTTEGGVTVSIKVKAPAVVYGNPLIRSKLSGKVTDKDTNKEIKGKFSWVDGYGNLSETKKHQWKFSAENNEFNTEIIGEIEVNVRKHDLRTYDVSCTEVYFGDKLKESKLEGKFYDEFGQRVDGSLVWDSPDQTVIEEEGQFHWTFVPNDLEKNNVARGSLIVHSKKSDTVTPVIREINSENIYKLDEFKPITGIMENPNTKEIVKGTFRIINKAPKAYNNPGAENVTIEWEFTPENTRRYNTVTGKLTVRANLRPLKLSNPTTTSIGIGSSLYESIVTGTAIDGITNKAVNGVWRWEKPWITIHQSGSYSVKFIPNIDNVYTLAGGNAYVNIVSTNKQQELDVTVRHTDDIASGERLGNSTIFGTAIDKKTKKSVKGEFYWMDPSMKATEKEVEKADYIFIPNDLVNYKPFLGEAAVTILNDTSNMKKPKLVDVSAATVRSGQMITSSKITGKALIDGGEVDGIFEWFDKSVKFVQEGVYYETVKFTPVEIEIYKVAYINVKVKVYNENQIEITDAVLSDKNSLDIKVDKKITAKEAESLKIDGYEIAAIELLEPSNSNIKNRAVVINNGYISSDRIRLITSEELKGQIRVTVETNPSGEKLDEEEKPDFIINSNNSDSSNGNNNGASGGTGNGSNGSTGGNVEGNSGNTSSGSTSSVGTGGTGGSSSRKSNSSSKDENISSHNNDGWVNDKFIRDGKPVIDSWILIDNTWYFTDSEGNKVKSDWINNNGLWYYLSENGSMKTGWLKDGANWYYLSENGSMKTGWLHDTDGVWYYLKSNGEMAKNEYIEGYYLGSNGALK